MHSMPPRPSPYRNAVLNVVWSLLCITPVFVFCYRFMAMPWIYGFIAISLVACAMPAVALRHLQLSAGTGPYRRLHVHQLIRFTQDAGNAASPTAHPHLFRNPRVLATRVRVTLVRERFHLAMFLFFLLTAAYAAAQRRLTWTLLLCLSNVTYNLYPIWLQQYIRIRLERCLLRPTR